MKRSEMQRIICELLEKQSHQPAGYMYKAQKMLEAIEKAGMQPPEIKEWVEIPDHNILGAGFKIGHNVSKWEPEDV